jgi:hypothetical protein
MFRALSCLTGRVSAAAALAVAALALPAVAHADSPPLGPLSGAQVDQALAVATAHWPANPCGGVFHVQATTHAVLDPQFASADPAYADGTDGEGEIGGAARGDCTVRIVTDNQWDQAALCSLLEHEIGHVLGLYHSDTPDDVMNVNVTLQADCVAAFPPPPSAQPVAAAPVASQPDCVCLPQPQVTLRSLRGNVIEVRATNRPAGTWLHVTAGWGNLDERAGDFRQDQSGPQNVILVDRHDINAINVQFVSPADEHTISSTVSPYLPAPLGAKRQTTKARTVSFENAAKGGRHKR